MAKKKRTAGGTPATAALDADGAPYRALPYEHDPSAESYGLEAAQALGVDPARVFKTLLVKGESTLLVGIVPVSGALDLKTLAAAAGVKKVAMAGAQEAERSTGYVLGGISPIGQRKALATYLDASADNFETILVSGGKRGFDLELAPRDLLRLTGGSLAPIARA
ncbi:Cys-tRNA(Pro) deacylase [Ornithinimicrobium sp. Arc0846-15]|nr:Cys-tRNA(Pro) deacylase [Ornithinimicrobium laminariae]